MREPKYPNSEALQTGIAAAVKPLHNLSEIAVLKVDDYRKPIFVIIQLKNTGLCSWELHLIGEKVLKGKNPSIGITGADYDCINLALRVDELQDEFLL